jgi:ABC-type transporter Mla subunit MlaD
MGFFDGFIHVVNAIGHAAEAALAGARHLAEEAAKQIQEAAHEAEAIAQHVRSKITDSATDMEHQLSALKPNFDEKMQDIVDEVSNVARSAADQGVDISEAIDAAIELAVKNVETALKAAIDAVNQFLFEAKEKLFSFLHELLPGWLHFALGPLEALAGLALEGLKKFGGLLKEGIGFVLDKIKKAAKALARKIGELLGPIWCFLKELWKMLFGTEPEHCEVAAQWFEERMKRIERELL